MTMAKPNRKSQEAFYDVFADMPLADQAAALRILEQVHRLAQRDTKRRAEPGEPVNRQMTMEAE
jgi:hypothetical protein